MPVLGDTISGNAGVAGATITLSGTASATTTSAADGTYSFGSLSAGSYVVTPTLVGVTFTPASLNETIVATSITGANFVGQATGYTQTQTVSDNFHRADSPNLGANWTVTTDVSMPIAVASDIAVPTPNLPNPPEGIEIYTGASFPNDQYASVTLNSFAIASGVFVAVRDDVTDTTGYSAQADGDGVGGYNLTLNDVSTGNPIGVVAALSGAPQPGDIITVQAVGTLITAFYNGIPIVSGTNNSTAAGDPVLGLFGTATQTDTSASLFSAGSMGMSSGSGAGGWAFNEDVENIFKRKI